MSCANVRPLSDLLKDDLERAIDQANLGQEDAEIARRYLIDRIAQIDIAAEMGYHRSTISRRMTRIVDLITKTAGQIDSIEKDRSR